MVTPTGLPAWTRTADPSTYGGVLGKRNLGNIGAVNAKTDVTAEEFLRAAQDLAHATRAAPLFWMRMTIATTPDLTVTVNQCQPQWAPASGPYLSVTGYATGTSPGPLYPVITTSAFDLLVTFPDITIIGTPNVISVADDYGVVGECQMSVPLLTGYLTSGMTCQVAGDGTMVTVTNYEVDGAELHLVVW